MMIPAIVPAATKSLQKWQGFEGFSYLARLNQSWQTESIKKCSVNVPSSKTQFCR